MANSALNVVSSLQQSAVTTDKTYVSLDTIFFHVVTIGVFDRQTDRWADSFLMAITCIALHAVA